MRQSPISFLSHQNQPLSQTIWTAHGFVLICHKICAQYRLGHICAGKKTAGISRSVLSGCFGFPKQGHFLFTIHLYLTMVLKIFRRNLFTFLMFALFGLHATAFAQDVPVVGGDRDAHGCISSAGYDWSVLRKECIRVFEVGLALDPQLSSLDQSTVAYVVLKSGSTAKAELFMPGEKSVVLPRISKKGNAITWKRGALTLKLAQGEYTLTRDKEVLYKGKK